MSDADCTVQLPVSAPEDVPTISQGDGQATPAAPSAYVKAEALPPTDEDGTLGPSSAMPERFYPAAEQDDPGVEQAAYTYEADPRAIPREMSRQPRVVYHPESVIQHHPPPPGRGYYRAYPPMVYADPRYPHPMEYAYPHPADRAPRGYLRVVDPYRHHYPPPGRRYIPMHPMHPMPQPAAPLGDVHYTEDTGGPPPSNTTVIKLESAAPHPAARARDAPASDPALAYAHPDHYAGMPPHAIPRDPHGHPLDPPPSESYRAVPVAIPVHPAEGEYLPPDHPAARAHMEMMARHRHYAMHHAHYPHPADLHPYEHMLPADYPPEHLDLPPYGYPHHHLHPAHFHAPASPRSSPAKARQPKHSPASSSEAAPPKARAPRQRQPVQQPPADSDGERVVDYPVRLERKITCRTYLKRLHVTHNMCDMLLPFQGSAKTEPGAVHSQEYTLLFKVGRLG
jgi:hypothetical protein